MCYFLSGTALQNKKYHCRIWRIFLQLSPLGHIQVPHRSPSTHKQTPAAGAFNKQKHLKYAELLRRKVRWKISASNTQSVPVRRRKINLRLSPYICVHFSAAQAATAAMNQDFLCRCAHKSHILIIWGHTPMYQGCFNKSLIHV